MKALIKNFAADESGAVTVDWVHRDWAALFGVRPFSWPSHQAPTLTNFQEAAKLLPPLCGRVAANLQTKMETFIMKLKAMVKDFASDESGVATVEVMAFGAAIFFGSVAVMAMYSSGVDQLQQDREYNLKQQEKVTTF